MEKTVYECDRCGILMDKPYVSLQVKYTDNRDVENYDYCENCSDDVLLFRFYINRRKERHN